MAVKQKKFYFKLKDPADAGKGEELHGHVRMGDSGMLEIYVEGFGEKDADDGDGSIVQLEIWEGDLRVLVRQDINCPDPTILSMEMAKESGRRDIPE